MAPLVKLAMPCAPDVIARNWSTVYAYDENNNLTMVHFYNRGPNQQTLDIGRCKYAYVHYHLPEYPYSQANFDLYLMNSGPWQFDATASTSGQYWGRGTVRQPTPFIETVTGTGLEEEHLTIAGGDGGEIHTATEMVHMVLRWN